MYRLLPPNGLPMMPLADLAIPPSLGLGHGPAACVDLEPQRLTRTRRGPRRRPVWLRKSHDDLVRQLKLAEQVQRSLLPRSLPELPGVTFAAAIRPTQHMSGDFYNVFRLDENRVGFYLGDVMGHGPAAALLSVYTMLRIEPKWIEGKRYEVLEPGAVLAQLNEQVMAADFPGTPFLTIAYGIFDLTRRTLTYSVGGHPHPLILRSGEPCRRLEPTAPLVGVIEAAFTQRTIRLEPGDRLVLYSDGAQDATWGGQAHGIDGLAELLEVRDERPLQDVLDATVQSASFENQPADDIALLALDVEA